MKRRVTSVGSQEVRAHVREAEGCRRLYRELGVHLPDTILCASLEAGGKEACQGDTGGGLLQLRVGDQGAWTQVGVLTAGIGCREGRHRLYTRLSSYLDWIQGVRRQQGHKL